MLKEKRPAAEPTDSSQRQSESFRYRDTAENIPDSKALHTPSTSAAEQNGETPLHSAPEAPAMAEEISDSTVDSVPEVPEIPAVTPAPSPVPGKKRKLPRLIAGIAAALVLAAGFCIFGHFRTYKLALSYSADGLFPKALDETIFLPGLTKFHDPNFLSYSEGGNALGQKDYARAREILESLPPDYRETAFLIQESYYRQANEILQQGDYSLAIQLFQPLKDQGFRDSEELYQRALMEQAILQVEQIHKIADVKTGLNTLTTLISDGYIPAKVAKHNAMDLVYDHALSLYETEQYNLALRYLKLVPGYSDSNDYQNLCYAHYQELSVKELWALRQYADAKALLYEEYYLTEFLSGIWYTKDRGSHLRMSKDGDLSYNLPQFDYGDYYRIEGGIIMLYYDNAYYTPRNLFRITLVNWNEITVYCYHNNSTYTLYRD